MLDELIIRNFQAHKGLSLEMSSGITTIIGPSDIGKSAIIRCLQLIAFNSPAGFAFITKGQKKAKIILKVDGHTITRTRSSTQNEYAIDNKELKAFKTDVPPEIQNLLNISDLNFQSQHESPFWFSETAGEVSRQLNRIVDLTAIDNILGSLASKLRSSRENIKLINVRIKTAENSFDVLYKIPELNKKIKSMEVLESSIEEKRNQHEALKFLCESIQTHKTFIINSATSKRLGKLAISKGEVFLQIQKKVSGLENIINQIESYYKITKKKIPDITDLENKKQKKESMVIQYRNLKAIINEIETANNKIQPTELKNLKKELEKIACPMCGRI